MNPLISQAQEKDHTQDFNFWIGTWDVYQNGTEKIVGESHISSILGGNAIREEYSSKTTNYSGSSLNAYNKSEDRWEQYYLDNGGLTLHITGGLVDGKMVLQNKQVVNGESISNKISWEALPDGSVRQLWEQKKEDQEKWTVAFDGIYKKKA